MTRRGRGSCCARVDDHCLGVPSRHRFDEGDWPGRGDPCAMMGALGILHVAVLVDDDHHVGDGLGVALEHLPP